MVGLNEGVIFSLVGLSVGGTVVGLDVWIVGVAVGEPKTNCRVRIDK